MVKQVFTPSRFKNVCQKLHQFKQKKEHIQIRRMKVAIAMQEQLYMRKLLEEYLLPLQHQITCPVAWERSGPRRYYILKKDTGRPVCDIFCDLLLQMLSDHPKLRRLIQLQVKFPLHQLLQRLRWLLCHVHGAINQSRDHIERSRQEEAQLEQSKSRYCRQLRQWRWNEAEPFVLDASMWTGSTAERYGKKRKQLISQYRSELASGHRLLHDEDVDPGAPASCFTR